jgi:hypothetical protein
MKTAAILIAAAAAVATAGSAAAAARMSDLDYLRASRCKGLAEQLGSADASNLDAALKAARKGRATFVVEQGEAEIQRGKRSARGDGKERAAAELESACSAYLKGGELAAR